jgi:tight adherence protein C
MHNTTTLVILASATLAALGVLLATLAFRPRRPNAADRVTERIQAFTAERPSGPVDLDEEEARQPFTQRVLKPMVQRLGAAAARRTPEAARTRLEQQLSLAGRPLGLTAADFLVMRYAAIVGFGLAALLLGFLVGGLGIGLLGALLGAVAGYVIPRFLLARRVTGAQRVLRLSLPPAMDLMSVCVEAGLTFEGAMQKVAERFHDQLGTEFAQVLREIRLGRSRQDALASLGDRSGVDEVHGFTRAVIQSDRLGTGLAKILKIQSDELRRRRRQRAQEMGARASLKMLFPMILFIFPALWIVLLGPAGLALVRQFGGA